MFSLDYGRQCSELPTSVGPGVSSSKVQDLAIMLGTHFTLRPSSQPTGMGVYTVSS